MKFLVDVRIHEREAAKPHLAAHLAYLNAHFETGDFSMFGAYGDGTGGMLIAEAASPEALESVLELDPLKAGNCAKWQATPLKVACFDPAAFTH